MDKTVECTRCHKSFEEAYPGGSDTKQGYRCATSIHGQDVYGHYGSVEHDMIHYHAKQDLGAKKGEVWCDECVSRMVAKGILVEVDAAAQT